MKEFTVASDGFRRELQREAQRWRQEELISDDQFQALSQQYAFDELDTAARDRFIMILLALGSVLVGIGALTFVAANWQALSQTFKAGVLFIAMMVTNLSGFTFVSRPSLTNRWQRIGQALLLLGALLLGANLALMGQIVHTSGTLYELCAVWALGIVAVAYGIRLAFLGMLALLLLGIGYWSGIWEITWLQSSFLGIWTLQTMPLIVAVLFVPLAYRCQSALLFTLSAIATSSALFVLILDQFEVLPPLLWALSLMLPYALLWAYDDMLWSVGRELIQSRQKPTRPPASLARPGHEDADRPFQPIARGIMVFGLSILYWVMSFQDIWLSTTTRGWFEGTWQGRDSWLMLLTLLFFSGWTTLAWIYLGWRRSHPWRLDALSATLLAFLLITAGIVFWASVAGPIPVIGPTLFNILLALIAVGMMREGLGSGSRAPFWWGLVMLTLQIISRVLEYETGLLIKSLVFIACGVGVILIGLWFERYVRTLKVNSP